MRSAIAGNRRTVLVTGATGAIGTPLVQELVFAGFDVRALVRRQSDSERLPAGVRLFVGNLTQRDVLLDAVNGAEMVFHLAAKLHKDVTHADAETRAEYERVNADATRDLATFSGDCGVRRFIYFSTISVYGPSPAGLLLDEASPLRADSLYAETKRRGEEAALLAPGSVVLRLAAVYGPRMKGNYTTLVRAIQRGLFVRVGTGVNRRTLVHQQDVVTAAMLAAERAPERSIYNVTDGRIHTVRDIVDAIADAAGRSLWRGHVPATPVRMAAGLAEDLFHFAGRRSPIRRATVDKLLEDVAVSGQRFQSELGFAPAFDLAAGWRHALTAESGSDAAC